MNSIYCTIYVVKNQLDGKCYVGQTWQNISRRFYEHANQKKCKKLYAAIQKYGEINFKIQALTICHSQQIADHWEQYFMDKFNSIVAGYNIREAGSRGKHSQDTKNKLSVAHLGKRVSPKTEYKSETEITMEIAQIIRFRHKNEKVSYQALAKEYKVSGSTIERIVKNKLTKYKIF